MIKKMLRKWLEVPDPVSPAKYVVMNDVKEMVEAAVLEAIDPNPPAGYKCRFWVDVGYKEIRGTLREGIAQVLSNELDENLSNRLDAIVTPEKFIDEVVQRIRDKQLPGERS